MKIKTKQLCSSIVFVVSLFICSCLAVYIQYNEYTVRQKNITQIAQNVSDDIIRAITDYTSIADLMCISVLQHQGNIPSDYEIIADGYMKRDPFIISMAFAPDGIINKKFSRIQHPIEEYVNLFTLYREESLKSMESGKPFIKGPVHLNRDTPTGVIIAYPVYLENNRGRENFWGFTVITIQTPEVFERLSSKVILSDSYDYRLIRTLDKNETGSPVVYESTKKDFTRPVSCSFTVLEKECVFLMEDHLSWTTFLSITLSITIVLLISCLTAQVTWTQIGIHEKSRILEMYSYRDSLTSLYNQKKLKKILLDISKEKVQYGIICLNVNNLKKINETYGQGAGNSVLGIIAKRISTGIKINDYAFRTGGDNFVILLKEPQSMKNCEGIAERLKAQISMEIVLGQNILTTGVSAGWALYPDTAGDINDALSVAEKMMNNSKSD